MKNYYFFLRILIIISVLMNYSFITAQTPNVEWIQTFNGAGDSFDEIKYLRLDAQGNVVVTGRSQSGAGSTYLDVVTIKYAPNGTLMWSHTWNNDNYGFNDEPYDMEIAPNGNIIIGGISKISASSQDNNGVAFVFALDENGNFLWSDSLKGTGHINSNGFYINSNFVTEIEVNAQNEIYVTGLATGNDVTEYEQMFVAKYNAAGQRQWFNMFNNSTQFEFADYGKGMGLDANGNAYVCGISTISNTWRDFAVWKINPSGNLSWIATKAGPINNVSEQLEDIITDAEGNSYTFGINSADKYVLLKYDSAGTEQWSYLFDTIAVGSSGAFTGADAHLIFDNEGNIIFVAAFVPSSASYSKIGVAKFAPDGTLIWFSLQGGTGIYDNRSYLPVVDADNNIYITGSVSNVGTSYFDIGTFKLDKNGNLLWYVSHDGPSSTNDKGHSMAVAQDGSVYVGGYSSGYTTNSDYIVIKYKQETTVGTTEQLFAKNKMTAFPNPSTGDLTLYFNHELPLHHIEIFDVHGKSVFYENLYEKKLLNHKLDLHNLNNGYYVLKAVSSEHIFTTSFVLQGK